MRDRIDDARDLTAVTLMGWSAKIATRRYQKYLATCIAAGMRHEDKPEPLPLADCWCNKPKPTLGEWAPVDEYPDVSGSYAESHPEWRACR